MEGHGRRSFIGRGSELARLGDELRSVAATRFGRTIVVGGEAGIGKSRLLERFAADLAPADAPGAAGVAAPRVLIGACLEVAENALPYAPFVEILRSLVRETEAHRLPALLGPGRAELTRLLPELATRAADLPASEPPDGASQARLFELVLSVLERLAAERPLVLVIEDVQWADRSTRDLLGFLSRALRDDPVLLLVTVRTGATGEALANLAFVAELEREEHVERLDLRPFDRDETAELAAALLDELPDPATVDRLLRRTDGNPFYIEELITAKGSIDGPLPPALRDVVAAHVAALSREARDILRAAAAAGRRIDDELLASALDRSPRELAAALREALDSGVIARAATTEGGLEFRHGLLQEVVDAELFPGERTALHAAFADTLEQRIAAGDRSVAPLDVGRHWDAAGDGNRALPYLVRAAVAAASVYAYAEALRLWERAAELLEAGPNPDAEVGGRDLPDLLNHAADCAALIGEPRRAAGNVQRALLHVYPSGDLDRVQALENRLRWHLWWSGDHAATAAAVESALAATGNEASGQRARVLAQLAAVRMLGGDLTGSAEAARAAIEMAEAHGSVVEVALAFGVLGWDLAMLGDIEAGISAFRRGQAIAESTGSVEGMALAATRFAALLDRVGRSEDALDVARVGYAMTERYGVARTYGALVLGHAAKAELALGRWDEVDATTAMGLRRGAIDAGAVWLQVNRARLLIGRGEFEEAGVLLRRARGTSERLGGTELDTALLAAEAELAAWSGRIDEVLRLGERGLSALERGGAPDPSLAWLAALVLRAVADSRERVGRAGPEALEPGASRVVAMIDAAVAAALKRPGFATGERALALIALLGAEQSRVAASPAPARWREVADRWSALSRPFPTAYARFREAEALLASGAGRGEGRAAVTAALDEAANLASALRAAPLLGLVTALATQARISLPSVAPDGPGAPPPAPPRSELTDREAEVLRYVAAGWTNQQIADALFITRKTASVHVSNIMGKLGAQNRGEAAALAHRLGLADDLPLPVGHE